MSNKRNKLFLFSIISILLVDNRFFYLVNLPTTFTGATSNKLFISIIAIFVFILYCTQQKGIFSFGYFGKLLATIFLIFFINIVYQLIVYDYTVSSVIRNAIPISILLLYFPLKDWLLIKENWNNFMIFSKITMLLMSILFIVQVLHFSGVSSLFLKLNDSFSESTFNYYTISGVTFRIYNVFEGFSRVFVIVLFNDILNKGIRKNWSSLACLILLLCAIYIVDQSRLYFLSLLVAMLIMFFVKSYSKVSINLILAFPIVSGGAIIFFRKIISSILKSINLGTASSTSRIGAIQYYLVDKWNSLLFGLGRYVPDTSSKFYYLVKGELGLYNYDDIGIVGTLASLGLLAFLWYLYLIVKLFYYTEILIKDSVLPLGIFIVFVLNSLVMSYLDNQRIMSLLFMLVIFDVFLSKRDKGEL